MFKTDFAIKMLYLPIAEDVRALRQSLSKFPLLRIIFETLQTAPEKRPNFQKWAEVLEKTVFKADKIAPEMLQNIGIKLGPLEMAEENEMGTIMEILQYFDFDIGSTRVNENEALPMTTAVSHFENLTLNTLMKTTNMLSIGTSSFDKAHKSCHIVYKIKNDFRNLNLSV